MPAALKLASLPYKYPTWARTLTTTATTSSNTKFFKLSSRRCWWWRRLTLYAPPAHVRIHHLSCNGFFSTNHQPLHIGFRGPKVFSSLSSGPTPMGPGTNPTSSAQPPPENYDRREKPPPSPQSAKLLTLPTILTIGRVAAVPLLVSTFYVDSLWGPTAATGIFVAASITDWLDGYLARKMKLGTTFGAFLDPVADKLMVAATLVLLCTRPPEAGIFGQLPWLLTVPSIAIIGREITMSAVREWAASQGSKLSGAVAVNNLGKWKTATQMTALTILLAARDSGIAGAGMLVASGVLLLYISAWLAIWSLIVYMRKIWKVMLM